MAVPMPIQPFHMGAPGGAWGGTGDRMGKRPTSISKNYARKQQHLKKLYGLENY